MIKINCIVCFIFSCMTINNACFAGDLKARLFNPKDISQLQQLYTGYWTPGNNSNSNVKLHAAESIAKSVYLPPEVLIKQSIPEEKSRGRAFFLSFLLPGLGEHYVGAKAKSKIFMSTEVALWLGFISLQTYSNWREEDYRAYASSYGGVSLEDKPNSYFINIGNYISIDEYNAEKLRERNIAEVYLDTETYYWQWPSEDNRLKYLDLRVSADNAHQQSIMLIGVIFANHVISAIDAMWTAYRHNKNLTASSVDLDINVGMDRGGRTISLTAFKSF